MPGPFFDVFLTGAVDASPSAQMRLAAAIAERYRLPAPLVAEALDGGRCRVAARLSRQESEDLVRALGALGAVARLWPEGAPLGTPPIASTGTPTPPTDPPSSSGSGSRSSAPKDGRITLPDRPADVPPSRVDMADLTDLADVRPDAVLEARGPDTVRCPIHGLAYNRRQASGCMRCLAPARAQAKKWREEAPAPAHPRGRRDDTSMMASHPVKRAFWGLAVALVLGFMPAVYYARAVSDAEVTALRARQLELSRTPASKEVLAQFDEIDAATNAVFRRGAGRTLLIWVVGAGVVGVVWTRLTRASKASA